MLEYDPRLRELSMVLEAELANRTGAKTKEEHEARIRRTETLQMEIGELTYARIKKILDLERSNN